MCMPGILLARLLKIFYLVAKVVRAQTYEGEVKPGDNLAVYTPPWGWTLILSTYAAFAQNAGHSLLILFVLQCTTVTG